MRYTSSLYKEIVAGEHHFETRVSIGESGLLIDKNGDYITFGNSRDRILVDNGGAESGYGESMLISVSTKNQLFATPGVGNTCAGEIDVEMLAPAANIAVRSRVVPYVRAVEDGGQERASEWLQKGVYYVDDRSKEDIGNRTKLTLHGVDAMLFAEADFPDNVDHDWPAPDYLVVYDIEEALGAVFDDHAYEIIQNGYQIQWPQGYSCREVLGYIGALYGGNWVVGDRGELTLITIGDLPKETRYLIDKNGNYITFGKGRDRIIV